MIYDAFVSAGKTIDSVSVVPVAAAVDFPEDQIRLFLVWFIQFPIGWFLHFCVRGKYMRHAVNLTLGILGMLYFFGLQVIHVVLMSGVSWLMLAFLPRTISYKAVYAYTFIYLSV